MRLKISLDQVLKKALVFPALLFLALPALLIYFFSDVDYSFFKQDESLLKFSFKHAGKLKQKCTEAEIKAYWEKMAERGQHMRTLEPVCGRERFPVFVELYVDHSLILSRTYKPQGFRRDLPSFAYEAIPLKPGSHDIFIKMRDSGSTEGFDGIFRKRVDSKPGRVIAIDFDEINNKFFIRS